MNYVQDTTAGKIKINYIYVESKKNGFIVLYMFNLNTAIFMPN